MQIVLDASKAPMDPAWVSVLRISCVWARGESPKDGAANMLTEKLWEEGTYNGGYLAFTRFVCDGSGNYPSDASEYFCLKAFIENGFIGACTDFADFLVCLITSIGAFQAAAQRTNPLGLKWWFQTKVIDPAGDLYGPRRYRWEFHQFCIYGNSVWDGCIAFISGYLAGPPKGLPRDTTYYNGLVDYYGSGQWQPTPSNGFLPGVYASTVPQPCQGTCQSKGYGPNCPPP